MAGKHFRAIVLTTLAITAVATKQGRANPISYLAFAKPTDTISVAGNTVIQNQGQVTYEAIVNIASTNYPATSSAVTAGQIYNAWEYGAEDEHFEIDSDATLQAYAFPVNWPTTFAGGTNSLDAWEDVAYVYDGQQERLYIDGNLVASRQAEFTLTGGTWPTNGTLSVGSGSIVTIGAIDRDGGIASSLLGDILSLRISDVARYSGSSYDATMSDFADAPSTLLLYDFDQLSPGATTIDDLSGNGHTGTFGAGFAGATSPTIVVAPEPSSISIALLAMPLLLRRRRTMPASARHSLRNAR